MEGIVLGRVGHYHVPNNDTGYCQTALVVEVDGEQYVNVVAWTHEGDQERHLGVPIGGDQERHLGVPIGSDYKSDTVAPAEGIEGLRGASFHLNRDCPWSR